MRLCYADESAPSARLIANASEGAIELVQSGDGDVNWGRAKTTADLNPSITVATDKRKMRELFQEHNVPSPALLTEDQARDYLRQGLWVVGRPDRHSRGHGFWLLKTETDLDLAKEQKIATGHPTKSRAVIRLPRKVPPTHYIAYLDKWKEFRVHILNGRSIRVSEKLYGLGNVYTTIKPTIPVGDIRRAAKKAVKAVGLDFAAVDVLVDHDGHAYALEVNAAPGLGGTMPEVYAEHFLAWYEGREDVRK